MCLFSIHSGRFITRYQVALLPEVAGSNLSPPPQLGISLNPMSSRKSDFGNNDIEKIAKLRIGQGVPSESGLCLRALVNIGR